MKSSLSIALDEQEWAQLKFLAKQRGLSPEALVRSWIEAGFVFTGLADASAALGNGNGRVAKSSEPASRQRASNGRGQRRKRATIGRRAATGKRQDQPKSRRTSLHDEIKAVLSESGEPMRARDIADAIRQRGRYQGRRSSQDVNAAMVSSRVSNPTYRDLFRRADRKIALKG